jgi:hypothetical protein
LARRHNKVYTPPFDYDAPEHCVFGSEYWHQYAVREYEYRFNSWGFRDQDHEQFRGQIVDICVGDSNTVNLGGPAHHSWCSKLAQHWDVPVLNLGIDDLGCFDIPAVVERARSTYRVRYAFILYNLQTQDQEPIHQPVPTYNHNNNVAHKIGAFKRYALVPGAFYQFDPPWTFGAEDLAALYKEFPHAHRYLSNAVLDVKAVRLQDLMVITKLYEKYRELQGPSWPTWTQFCQVLVQGKDPTQQFRQARDQALSQQFIHGHVRPTVDRLLLANRDGWHLSAYANDLLARYFREQVLTSK